MRDSTILPQTKLSLLVRRRPDLTHEQFRDRYEDVHAPLARSRLPLLRGYQRNYLSPMPGGPEAAFDVITEFWFDSREDMEETVRAVQADPDQVLAKDEAEFMDRASMRAYVTESHRSADPA